MSETVNNTDPNATNVNPPAPPPTDTTNTDGEAVPKEVYERMKSDMLKAKQKADELEKSINSQKLAALKQTENWQELAKLKEQEAEDYKTKYERLSSSLVENKKLDAIRTEALKLGIDQRSLEDLEMIDFNEVQIETTSTGKINVLGADKAVANLKLRKPHWFNSKPATVNANSPTTQAPALNSQDGAMKALTEAEQAWKKNPNPQTKKAYEDATRNYNLNYNKR